MKRYRHYKQDKAIILSCFGSVVEQDLYFELESYIKHYFKNIDIFFSFSSRMVLQDLKRKNLDFKNLTQMLADVDMLGYRNIVVASINLFPTDEHELLIKIVDGFNSFSPSNIRYTDAILTKTKQTSLFLKKLNDTVTKDNIANLYIIHGTPVLNIGGLASVEYSLTFLEKLNDMNYTCSLEGSYPFYAIKDRLINSMRDYA